MRKILNIFQTTSMSYQVVNAQAVYSSTGVPHPQDIDHFVKTLMNRSVSYAAGIKGLNNLLQSKGYALDDFLGLLHNRLVAMDIPVKQRVQLVTALADIDVRLKESCSEKIQLAAVVGAFHVMR